VCELCDVKNMTTENESRVGRWLSRTISPNPIWWVIWAVVATVLLGLALFGGNWFGYDTSAPCDARCLSERQISNDPGN
jgi:hypothetical protein